MPQVKRVSRRPPPRIEEERLLLLIGFKAAFEVPVTEEDAASEEPMQLLSGSALHSLPQLIRNFVAAKLLN